MIPLLSREAVRAIDADAVQRLKVPSIVLMENAGRGATDAIVARFADRLERVVIAGGTGQNGGDGWVVARHLAIRGRPPVAILVGDESKVRGDARVNLDAMRAHGIETHVAPLDRLDALDAALASATLVVDALFGTGLDRALDGGYAEAVKRIVRTEVPCVALDLPSGIDANTGEVLGVATRAALTVTFAAHKRGLHQYPGAGLAGEVVLASIGVPAPAGAPAMLVTLEDVGEAVAERPRDAHKGTAGHVLVVAGSPGRTGAALLAGRGALRGGAGLVTIATGSAARQALDEKVVELMTATLPDDPAAAIGEALALAKGKRAAVIGPGLGTDDAARALAIGLAIDLPIPAVLDADALTAIAADPAALTRAAAPRVITPHPGEAARLLGCDTADVQRDRWAAAAELARRTGHVAVLKGARSIVATPDGALRTTDRGTPALGVAGTGDVLSGVVASLLAEIAPPLAASVAVVVHALAGELAAHSDRGLLASEVADAVPDALERCRDAARAQASILTT